MTRSRSLSTLLCLVLLFLAACESDPPAGLRLGDLTVPDPIANALSLVVVTDLTDLSANGFDRARVQVTVVDGAGRSAPSRSVFFVLRTRGYTGDPGTVSTQSGVTDASGSVVTTYVAPLLAFVPPDSAVVVTATIADPRLAFAPSGMAEILLAPKGTPEEAAGGDDAAGGAEVAPPEIAAMAPAAASNTIRQQVFVNGKNFADGAWVTFVSTVINPPLVVTPFRTSPSQLAIRTPENACLGCGEQKVDVFVTNPDGMVSNVVEFTFVD